MMFRILECPWDYIIVENNNVSNIFILNILDIQNILLKDCLKYNLLTAYEYIYNHIIFHNS